MVLMNFSLGALVLMAYLVVPSAAYHPTSDSDLEYRSNLDEWETRDLHHDHWTLTERDYEDYWDLSARDKDIHYAAHILRRYVTNGDIDLTPRSFKGALKDLLAQTKPYLCPFPDCDKSYRKKEKAWEHWRSHGVPEKSIGKMINGPKGEAYIRLLD